MVNVNSSSAAAEDIIRAIVQYSASEQHLKTLIEEETSLLAFNDPKGSIDSLNYANNQLTKVSALRRKLMNYLKEKFPEGYVKAWCLIKHNGGASSFVFEAYQALEDPLLYDMMLDANEIFIGDLTAFMGMEPVSCAACFGDMLKDKENK